MRRWVVILVLASAAAQGHAQNKELPGPWGPMTEEAPTPKLTNPAQGLTLVRRNQMRAISGHYRSIETVAVRGAPASANLVADAESLRRLAENLPRLFEMRSPRTGESGAKAAIWDEPDLFAEHVASFQSATSLLHAAAQAGDRDALTRAIDATRYQCLACHFYYRRSEGRPGAEGRRGR